MKLFAIVKINTCNIKSQKQPWYKLFNAKKCVQKTTEELSTSIMNELRRQVRTYHLQDENNVETIYKTQVIEFFTTEQYMNDYFTSAYKTGIIQRYIDKPNGKRKVIHSDYSDRFDMLEFEVERIPDDSPVETSAVKLEFEVDCESLDELEKYHHCKNISHLYKKIGRDSSTKIAYECDRHLLNIETGDFKEIKLIRADFQNHGKHSVIEFNKPQSLPKQALQ